MELKKRQLQLQLEAVKRDLEEENQLLNATQNITVHTELVNLPNAQQTIVPIVPSSPAVMSLQTNIMHFHSAFDHSHRNSRPLQPINVISNLDVFNPALQVNIKL